MDTFKVTLTTFRVIWEAMQFANVLDRAQVGLLPGDKAIRDAGFVSHRGRTGKLRIVGSRYGVQRTEWQEWFETEDRELAVFHLAAVWLGIDPAALDKFLSDD